ncbi:MAG: hypothetical protein NC041_02950 [Bacteroides sp.]|nr:hypothetical protein [Prevotella sp.]MCM1408426.1 hypothetical protein [Treponema brennaborense]MCM1469412.1 hypothetical protein [Bacteroides sp.]
MSGIHKGRASKGRKTVHLHIKFRNGKEDIDKITSVQEAAKIIIEIIHSFDTGKPDLNDFCSNNLFSITKTNITLKTDDRGDILTHPFVAKDSKLYTNSKRCYSEPYDLIVLNQSKQKVLRQCRLSKEWRNCEYDHQGNYLWALAELVNKYCSNYFVIETCEEC